MAGYLIDVNLPYRFGLWRGEECTHLRDLNDEWRDSEVWVYARERGLTIVSKDADFSDRILISEPPPRVIHVKLGNMRLRELYRALVDVWPEACELSRRCRLVRIFEDRLEAIE